MTDVALTIRALRAELGAARTAYLAASDEAAPYDQYACLDTATAYRDVLRRAIQEELDRPAHQDLPELQAQLLEADTQVRVNDPVTAEASRLLGIAAAAYQAATIAHQKGSPIAVEQAELAQARITAATRYISRIHELRSLLDSESSEIEVFGRLVDTLSGVVDQINPDPRPVY